MLHVARHIQKVTRAEKVHIWQLSQSPQSVGREVWSQRIVVIRSDEDDTGFRTLPRQAFHPVNVYIRVVNRPNETEYRPRQPL